jgi:RES domain-containing protein
VSETADTLTPTQMIEELGSLCNELKLVQSMKPGSTFFRVRRSSKIGEFTASRDFGPPPFAAATQANRMNPPGIPMLYVSLDESTALAESFDSLGDYAVASLEITKEIRVLDLTRIPPVPSIFLAEPSALRARITFLHEFVNDMKCPVAKDDRIHVEYIPTQVVTEYFRTMFTSEYGDIQGIVFPSAKQWDGKNLVLFATQEDVVPQNISIYKLEDSVDSFIHRFSNPWIRVVNVRYIPKSLMLRHIAGYRSEN